jgi:hypothetical protein
MSDRLMITRRDTLRALLLGAASAAVASTALLSDSTAARAVAGPADQPECLADLMISEKRSFLADRM